MLQLMKNLMFQDEKLFHSLQEMGIKKQEAGEVLQEHLEYGKQFKHQIEQGVLAKASVRFCGDKIGWGLFAEEALKKGAFVGEYTGRVRKNDDHLSVNNYLYEYPIPDYIGRSHVIDATEGNLIRFVNHKTDANLKPVYAFVEGIYHLILLAKRDVAVGEELTYDYGKSYWYVRSPPIEEREAKQ